jgi:diphosphomevalonate decarboxylase
MAAGTLADGSDAIARPLLPPDAWPVRLVVAVTATGQKAIGSTAAMDLTSATSPYFRAWISSVPRDLDEARGAIAARDLERLGAVVERSALRMHASAMAAEPGILYWNPATVAALHTVRELRQAGTLAYFTIDAGPHVKVLCHERDAGVVAATLARVPGVLRTLTAAPGPGASVTRVCSTPP